MILADTSCWIEYFHPQGSDNVKEGLSDLIEADRLAVCGPVMCEVLRGAARPDVDRLRRVFRGLHYLAQHDREWDAVAKAVTHLQQRGQQPPLLDLLIAAVCTRHNSTLCHFGDRHFSVIKKVMPLKTCDLKTGHLP